MMRKNSSAFRSIELIKRVQFKRANMARTNLDLKPLTSKNIDQAIIDTHRELLNTKSFYQKLTKIYGKLTRRLYSQIYTPQIVN